MRQWGLLRIRDVENCQVNSYSRTQAGIERGFYVNRNVEK